MSGQTTIEKTIENSIEKFAKDIRERVIQSAVKDFEQALRLRVGNVAIELSLYFSISRADSDIIIHVKMEEPKP